MRAQSVPFALMGHDQVGPTLPLHAEPLKVGVNLPLVVQQLGRKLLEGGALDLGTEFPGISEAASAR